jgi:hypothetical protein
MERLHILNLETLLSDPKCDILRELSETDMAKLFDTMTECQ